MKDTYTVKKGDTLSQIGAKYGIDYNTISGYASGDVNKISPGEVLNLNTLPKAKSGAIDGSQLGDITPAGLEGPVERQYNSFSNVGGNVNAQDDLSIFEDEQLKPQVDKINSLTDSISQYNIDKTAYNKQYGIVSDGGKVKDLENQLKILSTQRKSIPIAMQQDSDGRSITTGGLQPITAGQLRKNALQSLDVQSRQQALSGNIETSTMLVNELLDMKYGPLKEELAIRRANITSLSGIYTQLNSKVSKSLLAQAKETQKELDKDNQELDDKKDLDKTLYKIASAGTDNNMPTYLRTQILNAKTPEEAFRIGGAYLQNPVLYRYTNGIQNPGTVTSDNEGNKPTTITLGGTLKAEPAKKEE
jgi:LysM repeat protein